MSPEGMVRHPCKCPPCMQNPRTPQEKGVGPNDPGGVPIYCDLFALRALPGGLQSFSMAQTPVWLVPDTCDLGHMTVEAKRGLECKQVRLDLNSTHSMFWATCCL